LFLDHKLLNKSAIKIFLYSNVFLVEIRLKTVEGVQFNFRQRAELTPKVAEIFPNWLKFDPWLVFVVFGFCAPNWAKFD
jgi:hypothetical protein